MSGFCNQCRSLTGNAGAAQNDVGDLRAKFRRHMDDSLGQDFHERLQDALRALREANDELADHQASCDVALARKPRRFSVPDWTTPQKPKKTAEPRRLNPAVLSLALAEPVDLNRGSNHLPSTGRCHTCNRPITGERRFCGPCLAKR